MRVSYTATLTLDMSLLSSKDVKTMKYPRITVKEEKSIEYAIVFEGLSGATKSIHPKDYPLVIRTLLDTMPPETRSECPDYAVERDLVSRLGYDPEKVSLATAVDDIVVTLEYVHHRCRTLGVGPSTNRTVGQCILQLSDLLSQSRTKIASIKDNLR